MSKNSDSNNNYFNTTLTEGYLTYSLSGFSSNSVPLIEFVAPNTTSVYLIPSGKTLGSILADSNDNISNYAMKPINATQNDPNTYAFGLVNTAWSNKLIPVTGSNTAISTINGHSSITAFWNKSDNWTETISIKVDGLNSNGFSPNGFTPPYITIGGYPIITVSAYCSYFSSLDSVQVPTSQSIDAILLADSPIVSESSSLNAANVKLIERAYKVMLNQISSATPSIQNTSSKLSSFITYVRSLLSNFSSSSTNSINYMVDSSYSTWSFNSAGSGSLNDYCLPTAYFTSKDLSSPNTLISLVNNDGTTYSDGNFCVQYWRGNQPWDSGNRYPSWLYNSGNYSETNWNTWVAKSWIENDTYDSSIPLFNNLFNSDVPIINFISPADWGFTLYGSRGSVFSLSLNNPYLPGQLVSQFQGSNLGEINGASSFGMSLQSGNVAFPGYSQSHFSFNSTTYTSLSYAYQPTSINYVNEFITIYQSYANKVNNILKAGKSDSSPWTTDSELMQAYNSYISDIASPSLMLFFFPGELTYGTVPDPKLYYNLIWIDQSEYVGLQYAQIDFYASTLNWNPTVIVAEPTMDFVNIPVTDLRLIPLESKLSTPNDLDDLEKISSGYYSAADLMVSAYYNTQLQKVNYILNDTNQSGKPTFLQLLLAFALKFNFTKDLLSEWINGHPFKSEPKITEQLRYAINQSLNTAGQSQTANQAAAFVNDSGSKGIISNKSAGKTNSPDGNSENVVQPFEPSDSINAINQFVDTVIPGWLNAYDLSPNLSTDITNAVSVFASVAEDNSIPSGFNFDFSSVNYIIPQMFRKIIKSTMSMGAFVDLIHPHLTEMNIAQRSLKNMGYVLNSDSNSNDNVGVIPPVTSNSQTDYSNISALSQLSQGSYNIEDHFSSDLRPLIYPLFSDVIEDVEDDVRRVRDLCQDRLHGMQYSVYQPELKAIFTRRIKITHSLIHLFTIGSHSLEQMFSTIDNMANEMNKIVGDSVDKLVLQPISHVLVGIAKFAVSALLDMTDLVAPGSEILRIIDDTQILRPVPLPLTPFLNVDNDSNNVNKNALFYNAVVNGSSGNATLASYECIVPWRGLSTRNQAANAIATYDTETKSYSLYVVPPWVSCASSKVNGKDTVTCTNISNHSANPNAWLKLSNVKPGLHRQRLATTAGAVDMWYSINYTLDSNNNIAINPNFASWDVGQAPVGESIIVNTALFCFVPVPVVELDGRVSLTKTMHKWCISAIALPGIFFKGSQTASYVQNLDYLKSIPGFNNLVNHVSVSTEAICCTADAAAGTIGMISSALQLYNGVGTIRSDMEGYAVAAEDFANIAKVTSVYTQSSSVNVMNSVVNGATSGGLTVNDILSSAWPSSPSTYSLEWYNLFDDTVITNPNTAVAAWYGQSWGRLLGDVLMGIGKLAYFLHAQHKVFKKWSSTADQPKQQKVTALGCLKNMLKNKWNRHKTIAGVDADIDKLNHSFLGSKDLSGLHTFEMSNAKNIRSILSDDKNSMTDLVDILNSIGGARGIN